MCVYVTSDADAAANDVRQHLEKTFTDTDMDTGTETGVDVVSVSSAELAGAVAHWHSMDTLRRNHALANHTDVAARAGTRWPAWKYPSSFHIQAHQ